MDHILATMGCARQQNLGGEKLATSNLVNGMVADKLMGMGKGSSGY